MTYDKGIEVPCDRCGQDHPSETDRRWGMCDACREFVLYDGNTPNEEMRDDKYCRPQPL